MTRIFKFGGASIQNADAIRHLASLLEAHPQRPLVVVVSAMGKTTDALEGLLAAARDDSGEEAYRQRLETLKASHQSVVDELFGEDAPAPSERITALFEELDARHRRYRDSPYAVHYDQTVCFGELLSTTLVAAWLNHCGLATEWLDARELIHTDDRHQAANIDWDATGEAIRSLDLGSGSLLITQGFIGGTAKGLSTTLGREGSDFTAAIIAYCLEAEEMVIWKDVPGLFNADPRRFDNAVQLERLSYAETIELAWHGAKVIHPKTLGPLQQKGIPLSVRSFETPDAPASTIDADTRFDTRIPACILREKQTQLEVRPRDFSFMDEPRQHDILGRLVEAGLHANLTDAGAMHLALCLDTRPERLEPLIESLAADYRLQRQDDLTLLTVRHATGPQLDALSADREILAERRNRTTAQRLFRSDQCPETWQIPY
jgi:aspartate kinase